MPTQKNTEIGSKIRELAQFLLLAERLKCELRHSWLSSSRQESVAEHTWMRALMAMVVAPVLQQPVDLLKVLKMIVLHDIAEVIIGDIPYFEISERQNDKRRNEERAMSQLLLNLPDGLRQEFKELWLEYEEGKSAEALFARALDHIEVQHQHNLAPFDTWEELEYDLVYTKMDARASHDPALIEMVQMVRSQAEELMKKNGINVDDLKVKHQFL